MEELPKIQNAVLDLKKGKPFWPHLALTLPDGFVLSELRNATKEEVIDFMEQFFTVMGKNCENFAILTGYWDTNVSMKSLGERAEELCKLYKK